LRATGLLAGWFVASLSLPAPGCLRVRSMRTSITASSWTAIVASCSRRAQGATHRSGWD